MPYSYIQTHLCPRLLNQLIYRKLLCNGVASHRLAVLLLSYEFTLTYSFLIKNSQKQTTMLNHQYIMHTMHTLQFQNNSFLTTGSGKILAASSWPEHVWSLACLQAVLGDVWAEFKCSEQKDRKVTYWHNKTLCIRIHSMKEIGMQLIVFEEQVLVGAMHPTWNISLSLVLLLLSSILQC